MSTLTKTAPSRALYVLSGAHGLHDIFTGTWLLVLAAQRTWLGMSYTQVSIAAALYTLASAITQPSFGDFFDRTGKPFLALWAIVWTTLSVTAAAFVTDYAWLLVLAILAGLGSAAFHAAGLSNAKQLAAGRGRGRATAIFLIGGNGGFALGTYFGGVALEGGDALPVLPLAVLICVVTPPVITYLRPFLQGLVHIPQTIGGGTGTARTVGLVLVSLILIIFTREAVRSVYATYLPQYFEEQGFQLGAAGAITALFLFLAAIGSFVGGSLSDRLPRRTLAAVSLAAVTPISVALLRGDGIVLLGLSVLLGLAINIPLPVLLMIGQEVFPGGASSASGYAFGVTFLSGALGNALFGPIADAIGLFDSLTLVGFLPLMTLGLFLFLPPAPEIE